MKKNITVATLAFTAPALIVISIFLLYPVLSGFYYSLTSWNGLDRTVEFIGLRNYRELLSDREVSVSLRNTVVFTATTTVVQNLIALVLALILDGRFRTRGLVKTMFFVPVLMSSIVVGYTWSFLLHPLFGLVNKGLSGIGLTFLALDWLGNPRIALFSVAGMSIWRWVGYSMVIYLAALQSVPEVLYESADIDGASPLRKTMSITLPLIAPAFTINILITLIGAMKEFDMIYVTTGGGPGYATQTLAVLLYNQAFQANRMGYGAAIAVVLFMIILTVSMVQLRILRQREVRL